MSQQNAKSFKNVLAVLVENFIVMFFIASGVGLTLRSAQVIGGSTDLFTFTVAFSFVWGLTGAGAAWVRERENVRIPRAFKSFLGMLAGDSNDAKSLARSYYARKVITRACKNLFIPGVQTPHI